MSIHPPPPHVMVAQIERWEWGVDHPPTSNAVCVYETHTLTHRLGNKPSDCQFSRKKHFLFFLIGGLV